MKKLSYTPKSLDDLQNIKTNIAVKHGKEIGEKIIGNLTARKIMLYIVLITKILK